MNRSDSPGLDLGTALRRLREALEDRGEPNPAGHSRYLLAEFLNIPETRPSSHPNQELTDQQVESFDELIERVTKDEPIPYLTGRAEFMGLTFTVDERVIIPRPETEVLVEWALELVPEGEPVHALDAGAGSGAIGLSFAKYHPSARVWLTDVSPRALELCRENAERLNVTERVELVKWDLFEEPPPEIPGEIELLLSNPPYVTRENRDKLQPSVAEHEPDTALFGNADRSAGDYFSRLIDLADRLLADGGSLLMEMAADQAEPVTRMLQHRASAEFDAVELRADSRGIDRVVGGIGLARSDT